MFPLAPSRILSGRDNLTDTAIGKYIVQTA